MKITEIRAHVVRYTPKGGPFVLSGGRVFDGFDGVIVRIETDEGIVGWGEESAAPSYMAALPLATLPALESLAPLLVGADPTQIAVIERTLDTGLHGHAYAKMAVDIACWDILGKATGASLSTLLGGAFTETAPVSNFIPIMPTSAAIARAEELRELGHSCLQIKVGGDPLGDARHLRELWPSLAGLDRVIVDANARWTPQEARTFLTLVGDLPFTMEQPCRRIEENLAVRRSIPQAFVLDESLDSLDALDRAQAEDAFDSAMLKLSRFGGISKLRRARDRIVDWGKSLTVEDMSGGAIVTAVTAHVTASTPAPHANWWNLIDVMMNETYGSGVQHPDPATAILPSGPGLGVEVDEAELGTPALVLR